jgi:hypothetical protein
MKRETKELRYEKILRQLAQDFDRRLLDDPNFKPGIPSNSYVVFQLAVEGTVNTRLVEEVAQFNRWVWEFCRSQMDPDHQVIVATLYLSLAKEATPAKKLPQTGLTPQMLERLPREFQLTTPR